MARLRLFGKIALVIIISLWVTNLVTVVTASKIVEKIFIDAFTISNDKILNQIVVAFEEFNKQNISIINTYRQNSALKQYLNSAADEDEVELFNLFYQIKQYLDGIEKISKIPTFDITIYGVNGRVFTSGAYEQGVTAKELDVLESTKLSKEFPLKLLYTYSNRGLSVYTKHKPSIIATKQLTDAYSGKPFGTIYISMNESDFSGIYDEFATDGNHIMVINKKGTIVSSNQKSQLGKRDLELLEVAKKISETDTSYVEQGHGEGKQILLAKYLPIYEMYLINQVDLNSALAPFLKVKPILYGVCLVVTCMAMTCAFLITRRITKPITKLVQHIGNNGNGYFARIDEASTSYEIQELQSAYNQMIDEIDQYVESLLKEQRQRRRAELEALQMQINPHFLYNTLATIKYLSWQGNNQAVTNTINALISLLQNTISKTKETITIEQEIENLRNYVTINQARYGEQIQVDYYIDKACLGGKVPKLILQPFLENAFFHAYQEKKEGTIRVFITERGNILQCEVIDDGDGIAELERINNPSRKEHFSGIGIHNVDERIKMMYGESYGVKINSKVGIGTTIHITLPFENLKEE